MGKKTILAITHIDAFEYYCSLGKDRTLRQVAEKMSVPKGTVRCWSSKHKWADKVAQRDIECCEALTPQMRYQFFINTLMDKVATDIENGKIKIKTVSDLERIIKLDLFLTGDYPVNIRTIIELPEELRVLLDKKIEELQQEK
ncbi:MAG: phage terminase small subunit-related protein [Clostridia bacterium]